MTRRTMLPSLVLAVVAFVAAACSATPAASPVSDPAEILTQSIASLKDVKTMQIHGDIAGKLSLAEMGGAIDLAGTTVDVAVDIPNKAVHLNLAAPSFMGTAVEAIVVDSKAYLKLAGPLAGLLGTGAGDKYLVTDVTPTADGASPAPSIDPSATIDQLRDQIAKLPVAPTKLADEKCGDVDCYHVQIHADGSALSGLGSSILPGAGSSAGSSAAPSTAPDASAGTGDVTVDIWSRKTDMRPAKVTMTATTPESGDLTATFTFTYDQAVTISAPPADQTAPMPSFAMPALPSS
jgi:hypothetical protein